jgi:hypothetical protein
MTRRPSTSIVASPALIGAVTVLVTIVAVFLAYNANQGLPFVPNLEVKVLADNASAVGRGAEIREGGMGIGFVREVRTRALADGTAAAEIHAVLEAEEGEIPVDTMFTIRPRSPLGLKYLEMARGRAEETVRQDHVFPVEQTIRPVDFDDVARVYDAPTRRGMQRGLQGFGTALAGRGTYLNQGIIEEAGRTIDVALPFLEQLRLLVSQEELRGLANDLRPTAPALARLTELTRPLYEEVRLSASCENEVLHSWSNDRIEDPRFPASGPVYQEAPKPLPGLAGESRNGDANGQWVHVLTSAGDRTVNIGNGLFAQAYRPLIGTNPPKPDAIPPFRPEVACETQEPPDLRTIPGPPDTEVAQGLPDTALARERWSAAQDRAIDWLEQHLLERGLDREYRVELP